MPNLVRLKRAFGWGSGHTRPYGWPGEITSVTTLTLAPTTTTTQPPAQPPQTQTATVTTAIVVTSPVVVTTSPEPPSTSSTPASSPTDTSSESGSPRSTTSLADHAPSESPASETVIYHTVSGTVTQTVASVASGPTIVAADTTASQPRSMNAGEKAAIAIACIFVFLLTVVIFFMWRKKKSQREHQRIHSPTHTISGGMIYIGPGRANGAVRDTIGSQGATIHSLSVGSSRFSTSDDGHAAVVAAAAYPDEKSPSAFASPTGSSGDARSASPRSSSPLLSPRSSVPLISPVSPISPMSPMVSMAPMSQIMPYGYAPGPLPLPLAHTHMAQLSPVPPMPNFPFITGPTTAATERLPYAWDNPPPSSEYLPGSTSRRSTFRTSRYANRDSTSGFPSPPYGSALPEDARSERSAPPMYSRD